MYRQGDVLIVKSDIPEGSTQLVRQGGRVILAHGESTGHAHAIEETCVEMLERDGNVYLRVTGPAVVRHEEHTHIELPAGSYQVIRQREYSPEEIRNVRD